MMTESILAGLSRIDRIATSYTNPDTDGVACALSLQELELGRPGRVVAVFEGELNAETRVVLEWLGHPGPFGRFEPQARYVVVDMNAIVQLPKTVDPRRVDAVIDHHAVTNGATLCGAPLTLNERVGAAATVVAELARRAGRTPEGTWPKLLAAAIVSNTLDLRAPSTTDRDRDALAWLTNAEGVPYDVLRRMRRARTAFLSGPTSEVLARDVKRFELSGRSLAISQVEAEGASEVADRPDLATALDELKASLGVELAMASFVDLRADVTVMVSFDEVVGRELLVRISGLPGPVIRVPGLALRKTHVLPHLRS